MWKSLICAKGWNILKEWIRWRLGNKEKIRIWGDKWLASPNSYKVQSPIKNLNEMTIVRELLEEGGKDLNIPLILGSF